MLTDKSPMPFGKYKGTPMADVPADYLKWFVGHAAMSDAAHDVQYYILSNRSAIDYELEQMDDLEGRYTMNTTNHCPMCEQYVRKVDNLEAELSALAKIAALEARVPVVCPVCFGKKTTIRAAASNLGVEYHPCTRCKGAGAIWKDGES